MLVLGIETSCDETAVAIVEDGKRIIVELVNSQAEFHRKYSGVFPEYASRRHLESLLPLVEQAFIQAELTPNDIDLIAVSYGPGLIGALVLGLNAAKSLSLTWDIPFIGVNHVDAHLYASVMSANEPVAFPALGVVLSGGHTALLHIDEEGNTGLIGATVDDAIGEAFDKVASILGLPYPGGPAIEELAKKGNPLRFLFKAGTVKKNPLDFSFSGLKTNVLYAVKGQNSDKHAPLIIDESAISDVAASFQNAAFSDIVKKTYLASKTYPCRSVLFGGGVTINEALRKKMELANTASLPLYFPQKNLCLDNAAMVAGLGYTLFADRNFRGDSLDLEAKPRTPWDKQRNFASFFEAFAVK